MMESSAYEVRCHCLLSLGTPEPKESAELEPRWLPLAEALELKPLAPGTRRVLEGLAARAGVPGSSPSVSGRTENREQGTEN